MKREWEITQASFDKLLHWLDADRESAGRKYENIRQRLIKIFACRGCLEADDLADETINRVTRKLDQMTEYSGDPALYFYGVAQKVHLEYLRQNRPRPTPPPAPIINNEETERQHECLDHCLEQLPIENRKLVLEYYCEVKRAKIDHRSKLADQLGIAVNALRIRAHRIRVQLQGCVSACMGNEPAS